MSVSNEINKSFIWKTIQFISSFCINIYVVRILAPSDNALFYSLSYLFSLISGFFCFGFDITLSYFITQKKLAANVAWNTILIITLSAVTVSTLFFALFYKPAVNLPVSSIEISILGGCYIFGSLFSILGNSILTALNANTTTAKLSVFTNILVLVGLIGIFRVEINDKTGYNRFIFYLLFSTVFFQGLIVSFFTYFKFKKFYNDPIISTITIKKLIGFSLYAFAANFLFMSGSKLVVFGLPYFTDPNDAANYIQVYKLLEYMNIAAGFIYFPLIVLSARKTEKSALIVLFYVRAFNTFSVLCCVLVAIFGSILFPYIYGPNFHLMHTIFFYIIPAFISSTSSTFLTGYIYGSGKTNYNFYSSLVLLTVMIVIFIPLVLKFHSIGAAISQSIAYTISFLIDIYFVKRISPCKTRDFLLLRKEDIIVIKRYVSSLKSVTKHV